MNVKNLWITVGAPGCGKSTWIKNHGYSNIIISRDDVRFSMMKDGDDYFANEKQVFQTYVKNIQKALDDGNANVYADATHLNERSRNKLLNALNLEGVQIHYLYFLTSLEECLVRNLNREGLRQVPESAIKRMYYSMSDPMDDEKIYSKIVWYINQDGEVILTRRGGLLV